MRQFYELGSEVSIRQTGWFESDRQEIRVSFCLLSTLRICWVVSFRKFVSKSKKPAVIVAHNKHIGVVELNQ